MFFFIPDYWPLGLAIAVGIAICVIVLGSTIYWVRLVTKPETRHLILITHPNENTAGSLTLSYSEDPRPAWVSFLSRPRSGYNDASSCLTPIPADSDVTKPVIQPIVKFEKVCMNGSFSLRLKTAIRRRLGGLLGAESVQEKPESIPDCISHDGDLASSPLLQQNKVVKLPHPLVNVNDRFMNLYHFESTDLAYEMPRENLKIGSFLGGGAFGLVYKGVAKDLPRQPPGSQSVAVKTLRGKFGYLSACSCTSISMIMIMGQREMSPLDNGVSVKFNGLYFCLLNPSLISLATLSKMSNISI